MRPGSRTTARVLLILAAGACSEPGSGVAPAVADSAGVRIVTNPPGSIEAAESWSLSALPTVEIGAGASPHVALFRVSAVVPLDDGRVAVGTETPPQALVFGPDGTLVSTLGRGGQGPGEFSGVHSVVPLDGDSLVVWDRIRRRMSVFTGDGRFAREVELSRLALLSIEGAGSTATVAGFSYLLPSTEGVLVLFGVGAFGPGEGVRRIEAPTYRITTGGEELASFGPFQGIETYASPETGLLPVPFGANTHAVASGDALVVGTAEAPELRSYGPSGALERIVRWPDHDRSVEGPFLSAWSDWLDAELAPMPEGQRVAMREVIRSVQAPRLPAYGGLVAADTGEIWVGAYPGQLGLMGLSSNVPRTPERRWLVFGEDGGVRADVRTPEGFEPYAVRGGRVWGVFRDELDVESVRAYELIGR